MSVDNRFAGLLGPWPPSGPFPTPQPDPLQAQPQGLLPGPPAAQPTMGLLDVPGDPASLFPPFDPLQLIAGGQGLAAPSAPLDPGIWLQALQALHASLRGPSQLTLMSSDPNSGTNSSGSGTIPPRAGFTGTPGGSNPGADTVQHPLATTGAGPVTAAPGIDGGKLLGFDPNGPMAGMIPYRGPFPDAQALAQPDTTPAAHPSGPGAASSGSYTARELPDAGVLITGQEGTGKNVSGQQVVYLDKTLHPTVGIGHKIVAADNLKVGDTVSPERVQQLWQGDLSQAVNVAKSQAAEAGITDPAFIPELASLNFQLGPNWRAQWPKTWRLIEAGNYQAAADAFNKSDWNRQTPARVQAIVAALRALPPKPSH
ncbi:MAG TPA: hypothetical protein VGL73_10005 [Caulobacteraceae bacterium]